MDFLDKQTFEQLYYRHGPRLEAYAGKFLGDRGASGDIVHDVFVHFWEKYQGKSSTSWVPVLFTMVKNRCIDSLRHLTLKKSMTVPDIDMSVQEERLFNETLSSGDNPEVSMLVDELRMEIDSVKASLPERCREIFEMSREKGMKYSQIAQTLGISEKAVEKSISKALRAFKKNFAVKR